MPVGLLALLTVMLPVQYFRVVVRPEAGGFTYALVHFTFRTTKDCLGLLEWNVFQCSARMGSKVPYLLIFSLHTTHVWLLVASVGLSGDADQHSATSILESAAPYDCVLSII